MAALNEMDAALSEIPPVDILSQFLGLRKERIASFERLTAIEAERKNEQAIFGTLESKIEKLEMVVWGKAAEAADKLDLDTAVYDAVVQKTDVHSAEFREFVRAFLRGEMPAYADEVFLKWPSSMISRVLRKHINEGRLVRETKLNLRTRVKYYVYRPTTRED